MSSSVFQLVQDNKHWFEAMQALGSVMNVLGWTFTLAYLFVAWRRGKIQSVRAFGIDVHLAQEAVVAASRAARTRAHGQPTANTAQTMDRARGAGERSSSAIVDIEALRAIVDRAFVPKVANQLLGKSILWVDDNPRNNVYEIEALQKMGLVIAQVTSTEAALDTLKTPTV